MSSRDANLTNDLDALLAVMPPTVRKRIAEHPERESLLEVVLDLGRIPEARFLETTLELSDTPVQAEDIDHVVEAVGQFGLDNRAGIERTLHRISALRNRLGNVIGLTCRVGRALVGTVDIVRDVIETGRSVLLLGRPGVGKTTLLREAARVLADELGKRVVVVDTSNEIAGDGDIPHSGIGRARRMQVPSPTAQHAVMIEAVENHMPEVVVIDEIGTEAEASAARTIAERGVQLIATAHGNALENLLQNPTLSDLIGGIQAVTLSDDEARRRGTQKTVLERKAPATFDVLIEIQNKDRFAIHHQVTEVVDRVLRGLEPHPEIRERAADGEVVIQPAPEPLAVTELEAAPTGSSNGRPAPETKPRTPVGRRAQRVLRIHPYAVSRSKIQRAINDLGAKARLTTDLRDTDLILTIKNQVRRLPPRMQRAQERGIRLGVVKSNTLRQIVGFLKNEMKLPDDGVESDLAMQEVEQAVDLVLDGGPPAELSPQARHLRQLQHELIQSYGLTSTSTGHEPNRRVVIFPR